MREFGFTFFDKDSMLRHMSFNKLNELRKFLVSKVPSNAYYSSAYYSNPSAEAMDGKGWLGADLIFDIDADHLYVEGTEGAKTWYCLKCGYGGNNHPPPKCPKCGNDELREVKWMTSSYLKAAIDECEKLIDVLLEDFGLTLSDIKLYFSGHRGFHIHVENKEIRKLSQEARREIVDYLEAVGMEIGPIDPYLKFMDLNSSGWMGRIARGVYDTILEATEELLKSMGIPKRIREKILSFKTDILRALEAKPSNWDPLLKLSKSALRRIMDYVIERAKCRVDERVTIDTHRLIRLPGSLHGKTGLIVKEVKVEELDSFDPLKDASPFKRGYLKVKIRQPLPKDIFGRRISNEGNVIDLEAPLAIYLIANRGADPIE